MNEITLDRPEPTDMSAPEWADQIQSRFVGMTAWAIRLEAEMDWNLTDQAREYMWALASLLDCGGYLTVDEVSRDELAALTA